VPYTGALLQYRAVAGAESHSVSFGNFGVERNLGPSFSLMDEPPAPPPREVLAGDGMEEDEPKRREFEPEPDKDKEEEGTVNPSLLAVGVWLLLPDGLDDEDELDGFLDNLDDEPPDVVVEPEPEPGPPLMDMLAIVGVRGRPSPPPPLGMNVFTVVDDEEAAAAVSERYGEGEGSVGEERVEGKGPSSGTSLSSPALRALAMRNLKRNPGRSTVGI
jgi:hypothetical protein